MTEVVRVPFSARSTGPRALIDGEVPATARMGLLHIIQDLVERRFVAGWPVIAREFQRIARVPPERYASHNVDAAKRASTDAQALLEDIPWAKVFDFCERLHGHLANEVGYTDNHDNYQVETSRGDVQAFIASELQRLFQEEYLAVVFDAGAVYRRGRRHSANQISKSELVLADPRLEQARRHYDKALRFFRQPSDPDYENCVKEAVCSVEAAAKALFPQSRGATLGDITKSLVGSQKGKLPKAVAQTFVGIYALRSGGEGVGHGGANGGVVTPEIAEFTLAVCASQVILLVDLANAEDADDIPF